MQHEFEVSLDLGRTHDHPLQTNHSADFFRVRFEMASTFNSLRKAFSSYRENGIQGPYQSLTAAVLATVLFFLTVFLPLVAFYEVAFRDVDREGLGVASTAWVAAASAGAVAVGCAWFIAIVAVGTDMVLSSA